MNIWQKLCIIISILIVIFITSIVLFICIYFKHTSNDNDCNNDFNIINEYTEQGVTFIKLYDNTSKVIYLFIKSNNQFTITPMYNSDGSLQLYKN